MMARTPHQEQVLSDAPATDEQLRLIWDNTAEVLYLLKVEGEHRYRWLIVNRPFLVATGLPQAAIVGKLVDDVIPEPSRSVVLARYAEAIERKQTIRWEETTPYPSGTKTGAVWITPVFDAAGTCTHLLGGVHDITERTVAEDEVRQLNATLEARVTERTVELEGATRELRRQAEARQLWAREVNDTIVQTLVAAETTADLGRAEESRQLLHVATQAVRNRVTELLAEGGPLEPGSLIRRQPAEHPDARPEAMPS